MGRWVLVAVALALVAVGGLFYWLASSLDGIVEQTIEEVGSDLLGTRVDVGGVSIDLGEGRGTVRGLRIANPRGEGLDFSSAPAIALEEITLQIDLGSLAEPPFVLELVRVAQPEVNAELVGPKLNLEVLRGQLAGSESEPSAEREGEPTRLSIRRFELEKGAIRFDSDAPDAEPQELVLPSFEMRNVGGTPGEIGTAIVSRLLRQAIAAVAAKRAQSEAEAWIDEKLEDRPAAADAAKQVLEGLLGGGEE